MTHTTWKFLTGICAILTLVAATLYYQSEQRAELAASRELAAQLRAEKSENELREVTAQFRAAKAEHELRGQQGLGQLIAKADEQKNALRTAIADSEQHERERIARAELGARLSEVVAVSSSVRAAMAESYQATLKWPIDNRGAGVAPPADHRQKSLQSATVLPDGVLTLQYRDAQGSTRHLLMRAKVNAAGEFHWACTSADLANIHEFVPGCTYKR